MARLIRRCLKTASRKLKQEPFADTFAVQITQNFDHETDLDKLYNLRNKTTPSYIFKYSSEIVEKLIAN
jgi:hypothetical protein